MIDEIDVMEQTSPVEWETVKQLKKDIIHRCILTGCSMVEHRQQDVLLEQDKYFVKRGGRWIHIRKAIESD